MQEYDHVDDEKDPVLECFTIRPQQLLQNSWAIKLGLIQDPAIVEANHRYWYCAACALVLVLWQARMLNKPPTPHPVKLEEKLGMPTLVGCRHWLGRWNFQHDHKVLRSRATYFTILNFQNTFAALSQESDRI